MPPHRVLLATFRGLPDLVYGEELVLPELASLGITAGPAVWDDPAVDWSVDLVVIRSTWDYHEGHRDRFVAWATRVETLTRLCNGADVVRDNTDKRYLARLAEAGVPVTPTRWLAPGDPADLDSLLESRDWADAVVKPAVSAGARDSARVRAGDTGEGQALVDRLLGAGREVMVQPYLRSVETAGERSLVFFDRELSHTVRKAPQLSGTPPVGDEAQPADAAAADELEIARQALATVDADLLYARVDVARLDDGSAVLMELELTEPRLFLDHAAGAAGRFAEAIARRL
jgi:glutathione synthase/RimK-type ligase-like ATP-grasp enzyme